MILGLLLLLLCFPSIALGAFAEIASQRSSIANDFTSDDGSVAYPNPVSKGDILCNGGAIYDSVSGHPATIGVTDTVGTTYDTIVKETGIPAVSLYISCGVAPAGGANTILVDPAGSDAYISAAIDAFSGGNTGDLLDVDGGLSEDTGAVAAEDITPGVANALILGVTGNSGSSPTITPGGDYTEIAENENNVCCVGFNFVFRIISGAASTFTVDWNLGSSVFWFAQTRSLKPDTGTPPAAVRRRAIIIQ